MSEEQAPAQSVSPRRKRGILKKLLALLVVLVALVALGPSLLPMGWVRDRIVKVVGEKYHRTARIESVAFGWTTGLQLEGLAIGNREGFTREPFVRVDRLHLQVHLLPLLQRSLDVDTVILEGVSLLVEKGPDGEMNFSDFAGSSTPGAQGGGTPPPAGRGKPKLDLDLHVEGVNLHDATLVFRDLAAGSEYAVRGMDFETGVLSLGDPMEVLLAVGEIRCVRGRGAEPVVLSNSKLQGKLTISRDLDSVDLAGATLTAGGAEASLRGTVGALLSGAPQVDLTLDLSGDADEAAEHVKGLAVFEGMRLSGKLGGEIVVRGRPEDIAASGSVTIRGVTYEKEKDRAEAPETVVTFRATRTVPPDAVPDPADPYDALKGTDLHLEVKAPRLQYNDHLFEGFTSEIDLASRKAQITSLRGKYNGGDLFARAAADLAQAEPPVTLEVRVDDAALAVGIGRYLAFLSPTFFTGDITQASARVTGRVYLNGNGLEVKSFLAKLNGDGQVVIRQGSFVGSPILGILAQGLRTPALSGFSFEEMTQDFRLRDGRVYTDGARVDGKQASIRFEGWVAFSGEIHQSLFVRGIGGKDMDKALEVVERSGGIPLRGTLTSPKVDFDFERLLTAAAQSALEDQIGDRLPDAVKDILGGKKEDGAAGTGKDGNPIEDVGDTIKDALDGLFGGDKKKK